jgi:adenylate kinase family enzyme
MENGQLVPDDIITELVMETLQTHGGNTHWILDGKTDFFTEIITIIIISLHLGYPRTRAQAKALNKVSPIHVAINLIVPPEVIVARIAGRWTHVSSGRIYNTEFNPPKNSVN